MQSNQAAANDREITSVPIGQGTEDKSYALKMNCFFHKKSFLIILE